MLDPGPIVSGFSCIGGACTVLALLRTPSETRQSVVSLIARVRNSGN